MINYNKYINGVDHTWYDSSNVLYSKCIDKAGQKKELLVEFKGGRIYKYDDVDVSDYVLFKNAVSNGSSFSSFIKKYQGERLDDIDPKILDKTKDGFMATDKEINETPLSKLNFRMDYVADSGEFTLFLNDKPIFTGIEGQVSAVALLRCMNVPCAMNKVDKIDEIDN
ncbi:MAG: KTSC domain-containing protein [Bacteroidales bacterium]|nr:KTSC domain-containing protein [Bacteroidales bacterium]